MRDASHCLRRSQCSVTRYILQLREPWMQRRYLFQHCCLIIIVFVVAPLLEDDFCDTGLAFKDVNSPTHCDGILFKGRYPRIGFAVYEKHPVFSFFCDRIIQGFLFAVIGTIHSFASFQAQLRSNETYCGILWYPCTDRRSIRWGLHQSSRISVFSFS